MKLLSLSLGAVSIHSAQINHPLFGHYTDLNQMVDGRIKEKGHSVENAMSQLSGMISPKMQSMSLLQYTQSVTHCHEMLEELKLIYSTELNILENHVYGVCFENLVKMNATQDDYIARQREIDTIDMPKVESDITASETAVGVAEGLVTSKTTEIANTNNTCIREQNDLMDKLNIANVTMHGLIGTGDEFDSISTEHSLRRSNFVQVSKHGMSLRDRICKLSQDIDNKLVNLDSKLRLCKERTTDVTNKDLQGFFDQIYNTSVHEYDKAKTKYNDKVSTCDAKLLELQGELALLEADLSEKRGILEAHEEKKTELNKELSQIADDLDQLHRDSIQSVQECNGEINRALDNALCPTKILRNVLVEKCDDFKDKTIVDCAMNPFYKEKIGHCQCWSETYSLSRSIAQENNTIGFTCPHTTFNIECTTGQDICNIEEYWGLTSQSTNDKCRSVVKYPVQGNSGDTVPFIWITSTFGNFEGAEPWETHTNISATSLKMGQRSISIQSWSADPSSNPGIDRNIYNANEFFYTPFEASYYASDKKLHRLQDGLVNSFELKRLGNKFEFSSLSHPDFNFDKSGEILILKEDNEDLPEDIVEKIQYPDDFKHGDTWYLENKPSGWNDIGGEHTKIGVIFVVSRGSEAPNLNRLEDGCFFRRVEVDSLSDSTDPGALIRDDDGVKNAFIDIVYAMTGEKGQLSVTVAED